MEVRMLSSPLPVSPFRSPSVHVTLLLSDPLFGIPPKRATVMMLLRFLVICHVT